MRIRGLDLPGCLEKTGACLLLFPVSSLRTDQLRFLALKRKSLQHSSCLLFSRVEEEVEESRPLGLQTLAPAAPMTAEKKKETRRLLSWKNEEDFCGAKRNIPSGTPDD